MTCTPNEGSLARNCACVQNFLAPFASSCSLHTAFEPVAIDWLCMAEIANFEHLIAIGMISPASHDNVDTHFTHDVPGSYFCD